MQDRYPNVITLTDTEMYAEEMLSNCKYRDCIRTFHTVNSYIQAHFAEKGYEPKRLIMHENFLQQFREALIEHINYSPYRKAKDYQGIPLFVMKEGTL